jgi:hypothetical protein
MHRLHQDDLVGHVLPREDWEIARLSAIAEDDDRRRQPIPPRCLHRRRGEVLHPARGPFQMLGQSRRTIGEYNFARQYQQMPAPLGGGLVKASGSSLRAHRAELGQGGRGDRNQRFRRLHSWGISDKDQKMMGAERLIPRLDPFIELPAQQHVKDVTVRPAAPVVKTSRPTVSRTQDLRVSLYVCSKQRI